ncbi:MAG: tryptophan 2,3-dioxygenase family protein [Candidatus Thermoplasmatota archaeon]|nr:tryptophan 2,3-dioxygenase family protein [Candidatus Thermoplasmatota archaeon]MEC7416094.1 tryptophan 2,3-dioxygenase family protein [Candidatus Thermoplasmatota archaeon]MEC8072937.1 tryptophan 2,3-dioxygenase family protein [Candidatus Thermoplasmatota archaeon]MEC8077327.1 tryptophan 2,3-dioxygenase family protein [Candidatus Thermoplasmatota archaeon]MEC8446290.1 tryptophan 2,3-dioxygenase family protein [Candidatus Thermoplasmatota archaeon]|tara:strand:- start:532 stop:1464 length:933 start_codon:yes stop_codon:yes gene_type:complete
MSPTYSEYLRLEELLKLQTGVEGETQNISNDELHFILVHQNFELWFKLVINELTCTRNILSSDYVEETKLPQAVHHMERVIETFKLMSQQWRVMETLEPQDFLNFRDELGTASGFESFQMREMESLMGSKWIDGKLIGKLETSNSLYDVTCDWLERTPIQGSVYGSTSDEKNVDDFIADYLLAHKKLYPDTNKDAVNFFEEESSLRRRRAGLVFIESYRELPLLAWPRKLISTLIELEQSMILWRTSHARMVERMIGRRIGTGGSSGVDYLDMTTKYRVFVDLWAVRSILIKKEALPELKNKEFYEFRGE